MSEYIPSPQDWVAEQVELYESSGGTKGLTLHNTDLPVVIVTNRGCKTGAIRKTPLMRVADKPNYILVASNGGAPDNPVWVNNLRTDPNVTIQDETNIYAMRVREVVDPAERERVWPIAVAAFPCYQRYEESAGQSGRVIPVFLAEPISAEISQILERLTQAPRRLAEATNGVSTERLHLRTENEPWSVHDILAHLRACSDAWGAGIRRMLTEDNPTRRYVSPRSFMKKPKYADPEFEAALEAFTQERQELVKVLTALDETDWLRRGTFTGTSARQRNQTVLSYSERIVNHEQPHLEQIESLLR